eukprot:XP_001704446.1 Hypothetical protein GL50803_16529 [Giardia lamblia ATCC 50803]
MMTTKDRSETDAVLGCACKGVHIPVASVTAAAHRSRLPFDTTAVSVTDTYTTIRLVCNACIIDTCTIHSCSSRRTVFALFSAVLCGALTFLASKVTSANIIAKNNGGPG